MIGVRLIVAATASVFGCSLADIAGRAGHGEARHVAMWLSARLTPCTFEEIGAELGNRGRNTVRHGVERIAAAIGADAKLAFRVAGIEALVRRADELQAISGAEPDPVKDIGLAASHALAFRTNASDIERDAAEAALTPPIDAVNVARRALSGIRGVTSLSNQEIRALACAVLNTTEPEENDDAE